MVFDDLHHDVHNDLVEAHGGHDVEVKKFISGMIYVVKKNWLNSITQKENIGNLRKTLKISNFIPKKITVPLPPLFLICRQNYNASSLKPTLKYTNK